MRPTGKTRPVKMWPDRVGALSGIGSFFAIMVGNVLATSGDSGKDDAASVLADVQRPLATSVLTGISLELLGFVLFAFFLGYLYRVLRRAEGEAGWLAGVALIGGVMHLAIKVGSAGPLVAAYYRKDLLTPDLARTLIDLNGGAFIVSSFAFSLFVLAAGASVLTSGALPRWQGWWGVAVGLPGLISGAAGIVAPATFVPVPFLIGVLWTVPVSITLARRVGRADARRGADVEGHGAETGEPKTDNTVSAVPSAGE